MEEPLEHTDNSYPEYSRLKAIFGGIFAMILLLSMIAAGTALWVLFLKLIYELFT